MGPERVVCAGWGQMYCAPFQLHESKLTAPYSSSSPGTMAILSRLSPASQEMLGLLGEGRKEPLFRETEWGSLQATLLGLCAEAQGTSFQVCPCPHPCWHSVPQRGQHYRVLSHMGERCQFCCILSSIEILKQTVTKQVNLTSCVSGSQAPGRKYRGRVLPVQSPSQTVPNWTAVHLL